MLDGVPSLTARAVAATRLRAPRVPSADGDPDADDRLARSVTGGLPVDDSPMSRYLTARTWFFDQLVVDALDNGVRQVVIAAAGYDGRALRYARPGVRWFEVDHPATQGDKRERLTYLGLVTPHITFVPADFTVDAVDERLAAAGCDPDETTLVLAEGVAVYLDLPVLEDLVAGLRRAVAAGSRLGISLSFAGTAPELAARRAEFERRVAAIGEPARTVLTAPDAENLFAAAGWQMETATDADAAPGRFGLVTARALLR